MPRPEKVQAVADIKERLEQARAVFVAEYAGLSVKEQQDLRRAIREAGSEFKVFKMTLARLAATEAGYDELLDLLSGPTGLTFAEGDAATTAKVLQDFSKDHARLVIKGAMLGSELLPPERVAELAELEPRDVLLARLAGAFKAPMTAMAGLMAAMPRNLASMIQQLADKAPADEGDAPSADDQPAEPEAAAEPAAAAEAEAEAEEATDDTAKDEVPAEDAEPGDDETADEEAADEAAEEE